MPRHRPTLDQYRRWRRGHHPDGTPRADDELSFLLDVLLSTKRGAQAVRRRDRLEAKTRRHQHTPPAIKDADYLHRAYGQRRGHH